MNDRLDFAALRAALAGCEGVGPVKTCSGFCRPAEAARTAQALAAKGCRRLVVGACRREIYEAALAAAMAQAGLKPGLAAAANIREQCAWVHPERAAATAKAADLVAAAVRRVALAEPLRVARRKVLANVIVLGGGLAGMRAALRLSDLGHEVILATRGGELGGCAGRMPGFFGYLADDSAAAEALLKRELAAVRAAILAAQRIRLLPRAGCRSVSGEAGNFTVEIVSAGRAQTFKAGALVLAVGAVAEFPLAGGERAGRHLNLAGLADAMGGGDFAPRSVAIILDLGGEQGRALHALALSAAEQLALMRRRRVVLYCRQVRVAAWGMEALYRRARAAGVHIFRYEKKPALMAAAGGTVVRAWDPQAGGMVEETFAAVVLAEAPAAERGGELNLPRTLRRGAAPENALQADNVWLGSAKSNQPGIYVIGAARGNSELRAAQNDAEAAALAIHGLLGAGGLAVNSDAPAVDAEKCVLCLTCLRSCPHGAVAVDNAKEAATMSAVACQRCGLCAALCPARAIKLPGCSDEQLAAALSAGPLVTVLACENSAWPAADAAGIGGHGYRADVRLLRVPCAGRVDERLVLGALERGAARVLILGCHREACRYLVGADHAAKLVERLKGILAKAGLDPARVGVGHLAEFEAGKFLELVKG